MGLRKSVGIGRTTHGKKRRSGPKIRSPSQLDLKLPLRGKQKNESEPFTSTSAWDVLKKHPTSGKPPTKNG